METTARTRWATTASTSPGRRRRPPPRPWSGQTCAAGRTDWSRRTSTPSPSTPTTLREIARQSAVSSTTCLKNCSAVCYFWHCKISRLSFWSSQPVAPRSTSVSDRTTSSSSSKRPLRALRWMRGPCSPSSWTQSTATDLILKSMIICLYVYYVLLDTVADNCFTIKYWWAIIIIAHLSNRETRDSMEHSCISFSHRAMFLFLCVQ